MKKVILVFMILSLLLALSSCMKLESTNKKDSFPILDFDARFSRKNIEKILKSIETKDKELLISLFSKNALSQAPTLETDIENLFEYYSGSATDEWYEKYNYSSTGEQGFGDRITIVTTTCDVQTSTDLFRIYFLGYREDTLDPNNIGIWSFYIIRAEDDHTMTFAYCGDGKDTPGINIGIPNEITWTEEELEYFSSHEETDE